MVRHGASVTPSMGDSPITGCCRVSQNDEYFIAPLSYTVLGGVVNRYCLASPWFLDVHHMLTVLWGNDKANAQKWDLWFGIHRAMDNANRFRIGIACLVMARRILKFDSDSSLQHQEKSCSIVKVPGGLSSWGNLGCINAYSHARIFGQGLIQFFKTHDAVMHHPRFKETR